MKALQRLCCAVLCALLALSLYGCPGPEGDATTAPHPATTASRPVTSAPTEATVPQSEAPNMVDERFELVSLVFRLAGREEYGDAFTEYQQELATEFDTYRSHAAVKFAAILPLGYDAVFNVSVHIEKVGNGFAFIEDIDSLVEDGRWTQRSAETFLERLNDFYTETGFGAFYQTHMAFYEAETQAFIDAAYAEIDLEWFAAYVDPDNLRCVYAPSSSNNNYGATVNETIVYCAVSGNGWAIVHEYCHSFANAMAHTWYDENPQFKQWCVETVDPVKLPNYGNGKTIAGEYVTRAYNTLYYAEHGYALAPLFAMEKGQGFPYIEDVYALITDYDKPGAGGDTIKAILGVAYEMGEEKSFSIGERVLRWRVLTLSQPLPGIYLQTEVGNIFGSKTGDVLYVEDSADPLPFLYIDVGETTYQGQAGYRAYARVYIEE